MYHFIEKIISWYEQKIVDKYVKEELKFWRNDINIYNGYAFKPRPLTSCLLFTDASDEGYAGFVLKHLNKEICSAKFDKYEKETSSTFRELLAVKYVLTTFGYISKNQFVEVNMDNASACHILSIGSSKPHLQNLAIEVFNFCTRFNIKLIPQCIPREQNYLADFYSRMNDTDNWLIDNESFSIISNNMDPFL